MRIDINNLSHRFDERPVLKNVNISDELTCLAIVGPSGGGKSTLLRILGGLIFPTEGSFSFNNSPVNYAKDPSLHKKIGFVFQNNGLFPHLSGIKNVELPLVHVHGMPPAEAHDHACKLLTRFGLREHSEKYPYELSGGQQQRIAIARAVAPRPDLLLLDEPTSALDPEYTSEVLDMVHELQKEGLNIITVTHEMGFARNACEKAAFLAEGSILEYGPSEEIFSSPKNPLFKSFLNQVLEWK